METPIEQIQHGVEAIKGDIRSLLDGDLPRMAASEKLGSKLSNVLQVAQRIENLISGPDLAKRYREFADEQLDVVQKLLIETYPRPSDEQLRSIGYAMDIAKERIEAYLNMVVYTEMQRNKLNFLHTEARGN